MTSINLKTLGGVLFLVEEITYSNKPSRDRKTFDFHWNCFNHLNCNLYPDFQSVSNVLYWLFEIWRWTKIGKSYFHAKVNFDLVDEQMWRDFWYFLDFLEKKLVVTWEMITELYQRGIICEIFEEISMKMSHFSWFLVILVVA